MAAGVAMVGFLFQAYRFYGQRSLRTWPKVHAVGVLSTWVGNAVFVAGVASDAEMATVSFLRLCWEEQKEGETHRGEVLETYYF